MTHTRKIRLLVLLPAVACLFIVILLIDLHSRRSLDVSDGYLHAFTCHCFVRQEKLPEPIIVAFNDIAAFLIEMGFRKADKPSWFIYSTPNIDDQDRIAWFQGRYMNSDEFYVQLVADLDYKNNIGTAHLYPNIVWKHASSAAIERFGIMLANWWNLRSPKFYAELKKVAQP